jgi:hypothetical protein
MARTIINDDGNEEVVYTQEELEQQKAEAIKALEEQLADKEAHLKEKLDQFKKATGGAELEKEEAVAKAQLEAEQARALAEQANKAIEEANNARQEAAKKYYMKSFVGENVELLAKLEESYQMINLATATEEDIKRRVEMSASLAGINTFQAPTAPFSGAGYAPTPTSSQAKDDYEKFKGELGINIDNLL